nr:hypothetical protein [Tanacetum cinerariifolium]
MLLYSSLGRLGVYLVSQEHAFLHPEVVFFEIQLHVYLSQSPERFFDIPHYFLFRADLTTSCGILLGCSGDAPLGVAKPLSCPQVMEEGCASDLKTIVNSSGIILLLRKVNIAPGTRNFNILILLSPNFLLLSRRKCFLSYPVGSCHLSPEECGGNLIISSSNFEMLSCRCLISSGLVIPCMNPEILMHFGAPLTSKCVFGDDHVEYLGHIITSEGVATDPTKIEAMESWPTPKTLKQLSGFLGYGSCPCTTNAYYKATFMVETDASGLGIGVVLQQNGHPIAFMNALSRLPNTSELMQINAVSLSADLYQKIVEGWEKNKKLQEIVSKLQHDSNSVKHYGWSTQQLLRKRKLVMEDDFQLKQELFTCFNESSQGERVWTHISMDFIDGLPMSKGKSVLLVVVDSLSKYGHFILLTHPYYALTVAQAFLDNVYKLHGLPKVIVSDRDTEFLSRFWSELFKMLQVAKEWVQWVPVTEYWYNTSFYTSINTTSYQVLYGQTPPTHVTYTTGDSANESLDGSLVAKEAFKWNVSQVSVTLPQCDPFGVIALEPIVVLDRRMVKRGNVAAVYVLIQWSNESVNDATWELYEDIAVRRYSIQNQKYDMTQKLSY